MPVRYDGHEAARSWSTIPACNDAAWARADGAAGTRGFPERAKVFELDLASLLGPMFFMWVMQLLLPVSGWPALRPLRLTNSTVRGMGLGTLQNLCSTQA